MAIGVFQVLAVSIYFVRGKKKNDSFNVPEDLSCPVASAVFTTSPWGGPSCCLHFTEEETETQRSEMTCPGHGAGKRWRWNSNPASLQDGHPWTLEDTDFKLGNVGRSPFTDVICPPDE